ncbi:MAG: helix-turn-helix domain-containing protein [Candidatus Falkowbacteria bacterium]
MTEFTKKHLGTSNGLGARLKAARELRQINPEEAARRLNIRLEYLLAIEGDRFDRLPAGLYSKNYIKDYAALLGFPAAEIKKWISENLEITNETSNPFSQKIVRRKEFMVFPKLIKNLILGLIFLACLLYLGFYFKKIVFPPYLVVYQPDKNLKISENFIEVKGSTEPEAELNINGEAVLNTSQGNFSATINLKKGVNNLIIKAKKKYSGEAVILRQILVE